MIGKAPRPIRAIDLLTKKEYFFESISKAARMLGLTYASVHNVVDGLYKNAAGYYFWDAEKPLNIDIDTYRHNVHRRPIKATHIDSGREYIFYSITEAAEELNMSKTSVWRALKGRRKRALGFMFEYVVEEK